MNVSELERMSYFCHNSRVYRVVEIQARRVVCKAVMFRMDTVWHEADVREAYFAPDEDVQPCTVGPLPRLLYSAGRNNDDRAIFTSLGLAKEWVGESVWSQTSPNYWVSDLGTIVRVECLA